MGSGLGWAVGTCYPAQRDHRDVSVRILVMSGAYHQEGQGLPRAHHVLFLDVEGGPVGSSCREAGCFGFIYACLCVCV